jgi:type IV pilus assembly protein PilW
MLKFKANREQGFTLIELLIAMAISLVIIAALSSAFISQRKTYAVQEQVSEMVQGARAAMDMISRELKMAGYDPTNSGNFPLPYNSDSSTIDIYADVTDPPDGAVSTSTGSKEHITYSKASGENIIRRNTNTGAGNQQFALNIQSITFTYWDDADPPNEITSAANESEIRSVKIEIEAKTAEEDPNYTHPTNGDGYRTYTLTSRVTPPNLSF